MPSGNHEGFIELFLKEPELIETVGGIPVPRQSPEAPMRWRPASPILNPNKSLELRSDALFEYGQVGSNDSALVVIFEVQRERKKGKRATWVKYLASAVARYDCEVRLLIVCPSARVAEWARQALDMRMHGMRIEPMVVGPDDVPAILDPEEAVRIPVRMVLSMMLHAGRPEVRTPLLKAFVALVNALPDDEWRTYVDIVFTTIDPEARDELAEVLMTVIEERRSFFAELHERGRKQGEATGEAAAILKFLAARGVAVPEDARAMILGCEDGAQLDTWLVRAATATTVDEVLAAGD
jgi:hypothetical protein